MSQDTITTTQIENLMSEAGEAGDWAQVALCHLALGHDLADEVIGGRPGDTVISREMTQAEARQACQTVINDVRAS